MSTRADLTSLERRALEAVGMRRDSGTDADASRARLDAEAWVRRLYDSGLKICDAAKLLGASEQEVEQRVSAGSLLAINGTEGVRLPSEQFYFGGLLPHLDKVLDALPKWFSVLESVSWLTLPDAELADKFCEARTPREVLLSGQSPEAVVQLARDLQHGRGNS